MIEIETCKITSGCTKWKLHHFRGYELVNYVLVFALKVNMYCDCSVVFKAEDYANIFFGKVDEFAY